MLFRSKKESVIKKFVKSHDQNDDISIKFFKFEDFRRLKMLLEVTYQLNISFQMCLCFPEIS